MCWSSQFCNELASHPAVTADTMTAVIQTDQCLSNSCINQTFNLSHQGPPGLQGLKGEKVSYSYETNTIHNE